MEYKKVQSWYKTIERAIKEIGKTLYLNFISGGSNTRDGFTDEEKYSKMEWDHRHYYKKTRGKTKETIDNKL